MFILFKKLLHFLGQTFFSQTNNTYFVAKTFLALGLKQLTLHVVMLLSLQTAMENLP